MIFRWLIQCHNEWCSGPEIFEVRKEKPTEEFIRCPSCGWPSSPSGGYVPVQEEEISDDMDVLLMVGTTMKREEEKRE